VAGCAPGCRGCLARSLLRATCLQRARVCASDANPPGPCSLDDGAHVPRCNKCSRGKDDGRARRPKHKNEPRRALRCRRPPVPAARRVRRHTVCGAGAGCQKESRAAHAAPGPSQSLQLGDRGGGVRATPPLEPQPHSRARPVLRPGQRHWPSPAQPAAAILPLPSSLRPCSACPAGRTGPSLALVVAAIAVAALLALLRGQAQMGGQHEQAGGTLGHPGQPFMLMLAGPCCVNKSTPACCRKPVAAHNRAIKCPPYTPRRRAPTPQPTCW